MSNDNETNGISLKKLTEIQSYILEEIESLRYGDPDDQPTVGEQLADHVVMFLGSWKCIIIQSFILFIWVIINIIAAASGWDPYPFTFLNLILSFQAAYASPLILMAANRSDMKDRRRAVDAYRSISSIEKMLNELNRNLGDHSCDKEEEEV